jgi:hypothetical protein
MAARSFKSTFGGTETMDIDESTKPFLIPCGLVMSVTDVDPDYLRIDISLGDGAFAGQAELYESPELPFTLAAQPASDPITSTHGREQSGRRSRGSSEIVSVRAVGI